MDARTTDQVMEEPRAVFHIMSLYAATETNTAIIILPVTHVHRVFSKYK